MSEIRVALAAMGLPRRRPPRPADSPKRFPDGAQYRIEIPSTEGPGCLRAVLDEAARLDVRVHRVSQGSGVFILTDDELDEMAAAARRARRGQRCSRARTPAGRLGHGAGAGRGGARRAPRAARTRSSPASTTSCGPPTHGFRSVLIADIGVLAVFGDAARRRAAGRHAGEGVGRCCRSRTRPPRGCSRARRNTLNLPTDLTLPQIAAIRAAVDVPIDFYVEAPDNLGGFVRHHEIPELDPRRARRSTSSSAAQRARHLSVRRAPEATAIALSRERVRRARPGAGAARAQRRVVHHLGAGRRRPGAARRAIGERRRARRRTASARRAPIRRPARAPAGHRPSAPARR